MLLVLYLAVGQCLFPVEQLGGPYRALRAFRPLLFLETPQVPTSPLLQVNHITNDKISHTRALHLACSPDTWEHFKPYPCLHAVLVHGFLRIVVWSRKTPTACM